MKPKYVGDFMRKGWKDEMPFYIIECPKHGSVLAYPHGFEGRLDCPECMKEMRKDG